MVNITYTRKKVKQKCVICSASFFTRYKGKTCSRKCRGRYVQPMRDKHPSSGPFESNCKAKYWSLLSPNGGISYRFRNLNHFIRNNPDLFSGEDSKTGYLGRRFYTRAANGLNHLRPDLAKPFNSWRGWKWDFVSSTI